MAFQEFYVDAATGSNINAGDDKTVVTSTNGDWDNASSNRFTAASGTPFSGVAVGDYASVYLDGASLAVFIGRVTAVNGGGASLDISNTIKGGTKPSAGATGRTCTVGGKWAGPSGSVGFPFNFVNGAMTKVTTGDIPRVNFKNGTSYLPTSAMTHTLAGPVVFQGYTSTVGDGGRATIDGSTNAIVLFTVSTGAGNEFIDFIFTNPAASGTNALVVSSSAATCWRRCVFHSCRSTGLNLSSGSAIECEAYGCNSANSSGIAAFAANNGVEFVRCIAHDNTGANNSGFVTGSFQSFCYFTECVSETNGKDGITVNGSAFVKISKCDFYNNTGSGIVINNSSGLGAATANVTIESCNFIKNGAYGINGTGAGERIGEIRNCGFGSGTAANTSGTTTGLKGIVETGSVTYGSNLLPWVDAPNGDFRINLAAAKGAGRGTFTQTASSYAGAVGYPDIGSNQHADAGSSSVKFDGGMVGGMRG